MSLRKLDIPLDNTFSKQYKLDTYGFYINKIPPNMEAYLILDTDPNQQIDLSAQTKIPRNKMIKSFILANRKSLPGKTLNLYYAETINDFNDLPEAPNAGIEGNLIDTNQILDELNNKTTIVNTDNIKLTVDNIGLAKEATLSSMIQYIDEIEGKLDTLNLKDFATQTTLSSINLNVDEIETKLDTLNSKDFATQTTLNSVLTELTNIKNINQSILNNLTALNITYDTAETFTSINTTQDFTVTITNNAVFDSNDYTKTATATDTNNTVYTCVYYDNSTKELTFNADTTNGSASINITVNYQKQI